MTLEKPYSDLSARTKSFGLRIIELFRKLPRDHVAATLGRQVLRSGTSVGAHYRESNRSRSDAEFISKIGGLLMELDETRYWLELILDSRLFSEDRMSAILDETDQLLAIFGSIYSKLKRKER